jgi:hypothetical protein
MKSGITNTVAVDLLEKHILLQSPTRIEELVKIFIHALKVFSEFLLVSLLHIDVYELTLP